MGVLIGRGRLLEQGRLLKNGTQWGALIRKVAPIGKRAMNRIITVRQNV